LKRIRIGFNEKKSKMLGMGEVSLIQEMLLYTYPDKFVIAPVKPLLQQHMVVSRFAGVPDGEAVTLEGVRGVI
jgi:hypothetical protein